MTVLALALAAGWALSVTALVRALTSERRQAARERDTLLNQVMHLSGKTWTPPPADDSGEVAALKQQITDLKTERAERFTLSPAIETLS